MRCERAATAAEAGTDGTELGATSGEATCGEAGGAWTTVMQAASAIEAATASAKPTRLLTTWVM